jgi:hypothetical protein
MNLKIKSWEDVRLIITNKFDVVDAKGYKVPFVRFLSFSLLEITNIINERTWSYEVE